MLRNKGFVLALLASALIGPRAVAQEITVWDYKSGDPVTASYFQTAKDGFEKAHPGVTIDYTMQPHDQYYTLIGTALSSNNGPDLFLMDGGSQARARTGALLKLNDAVKDVHDSMVGWPEFSSPDGGIYAVPISIQGFPVYYNKSLYVKAGLDPNKPPKTWADLVKVCDAFKAKSMACFSFGNKEGYAAEFWFAAIAANEWTNDEQKAFADGKLAWSSPKVEAVLQSMVDANAAGWFPHGVNSTSKFMDEYEGFERGEEPQTIGLISDVAHWKMFDDFLGADQDGVYIMPSPTVAADKTPGNPMLPLGGGIGYGVNKASKNAALATEFAKYLATPGPMQVFFNDAGAITANTNVDTHDLASPAGKTVLGWLKSNAATMATRNMSAKELEELYRQSQLMLNGTPVAEAAARLDAVRAEARQ